MPLDHPFPARLPGFAVLSAMEMFASYPGLLPSVLNESSLLKPVNREARWEHMADCVILHIFLVEGHIPVCSAPPTYWVMLIRKGWKRDGIGHRDYYYDYDISKSAANNWACLNLLLHFISFGQKVDFRLNRRGRSLGHIALRDSPNWGSVVNRIGNWSWIMIPKY